MVGDQIKYEPIWQSPKKKKLLNKTGIAQDCLSSASAGLTNSSIAKVLYKKQASQTISKDRLASGTLRLEDVGLQTRGHNNKIRSFSNAH